MNQSQFSHQNQTPVSYPALGTAAQGTYMAPPPAGYPTMAVDGRQQIAPVETKSRGDGFWKGWCVYYAYIHPYCSYILNFIFDVKNTCLQHIM
ncbi:hypothetical protein SAY87_010586 [Trapa incisa]|uniref:Uncharacterized protein n=1 Tax=Trapa incisa TaxID=236973 RepID=A0AAN7GLQ1_9MYRT|nr:hypothetical protein SAY87_010586 [Trapa incisa]